MKHVSGKEQEKRFISCLSMTKKAVPTGIVLVCGENSAGAIVEAESLKGLQIVSLCGVGEKSYALTESEAFDVDSGEVLEVPNPKSISSGVGHFVSVTFDGEMYSWGLGEYGELGLGAKYNEVDVPLKIPHNASFSSVSCGDNHTCALDERGNMYTWGQNFNRQLGIYRKTESDLPMDCVVEEIMMIPKFVPLSLSNPIKAVACGSFFTIAVTMVRDVITFELTD
jgi:alpha-tubulin suppressor-like RCC1 family protein